MNYTLWIVIAVLVIVAVIVLTKKTKSNSGKKGSELIEKSGIVIQDIVDDKTPGKIKIAGQEWLAVSCDGVEIPKNSKVLVKKVSGENLVVEVVRFTAAVSE